MILPGQNEIMYHLHQEENKKGSFLMMEAEKDIEKIHFNAQDLLSLYQESYFLYDRSNLVKQSFVNKISKFIP